ncbi:efflux RND transporter periplasmic adaptor subunit [Pectinatus haikarae]|uniref:efflux RND transporter periplasmic adaptor subunit n=1 Tax=Pectinatus haikarae TaxID=349096 RepID=UPI0018C45E19|nr:efflux RND transporter periplasmic adaptor subunit [Pectinatus haikarae]
MNIRIIKFLCLGLAAIFLTIGCGKKEAPAAIAPLVKTQKIDAASDSLSNTYAGSVHGRYETNLSFQVGGKILQRTVQAGDRVHVGDILMTLDSKDIVQQVNQSEAKAEAAYAELQLAKANLSRYNQLFAQNAVPKASLDQYQTTYNSALAGYQQATAQTFQDRNSLSYTNLTADADGVISAIDAEAGQVISAGQTVLTLVQTNELEVEINVPENSIGELAVNAHALVSFWALPDSSVDGTIREISPVADPTARTYRVRISLPQPPDNLKLGMTAGVVCTLSDTASSTYILPLSAIYQTGNNPEVWIVSEDKTVSLKQVQVFSFDENHVKVLGLNNGDIVVTAGVQKLRDGETVRLDDSNTKGSNT